MPKDKQAIQKMAEAYAKTNYSGTNESKYVMAVSRYSYEGGYTAAVEDMEKEAERLSSFITKQSVEIANINDKYDYTKTHIETNSINFAEWLQMQSWSWCHNKKEWKPWCDGHVFHNDPGISTKQLYDKYTLYRESIKK